MSGLVRASDELVVRVLADAADLELHDVWPEAEIRDDDAARGLGRAAEVSPGDLSTQPEVGRDVVLHNESSDLPAAFRLESRDERSQDLHLPSDGRTNRFLIEQDERVVLVDAPVLRASEDFSEHSG